MRRTAEETRPQALEAEKALLGCMMRSPQELARIREAVQPQDLQQPTHRKLFRVLCELADQGRDTSPVGLIDAVALRPDLGLGPKENPFLVEVSLAPHPAAAPEQYIEPILNAAGLCRLLDFGQDVIGITREATDAGTARDRVAALLEGLGNGHAPRTGPEVLALEELLARQFAPPAWLVEGLLPVGVCVLAGPPKVKKSFWALGIGLSLAAGAPALGKLPTERAGVLCCFLEDRFDEVKERAEQLVGEAVATGQIPPQTMFIAQDCPRMDEGGETWLSRWLADHPHVKFVVLDPLMRVRGGRARARAGQSSDRFADDYEDMEAFKRLADRHQVCLLILHHCRKLPAEDWVNSLNGSTALAAAADCVMLLQSERGQAEAVLRATGRRVRDLELLLHWEDHSGWNLLGDARTFARSREQEEVVATLQRAGGPLRLAALVARVMEATGAEEPAVRKRIQRMADKGTLQREGGLYWLPPKKDDADAAADPQPETDENPECNATPGECELPVPGVPGVPPVLSVLCPNEAPPEGPGDGRNGGNPTPGTLGHLGHVGHLGHLGQASEAVSPPDPARMHLRSRGLAHGFPALDLGDLRVAAGEPAWAAFCRDGEREQLERVDRALDGDLSGEEA